MPGDAIARSRMGRRSKAGGPRTAGNNARLGAHGDRVRMSRSCGSRPTSGASGFSVCHAGSRDRAAALLGQRSRSDLFVRGGRRPRRMAGRSSSPSGTSPAGSRAAPSTPSPPRPPGEPAADRACACRATTRRSIWTTCTLESDDEAAALLASEAAGWPRARPPRFQDQGRARRALDAPRGRHAPRHRRHPRRPRRRRAETRP